MKWPYLVNLSTTTIIVVFPAEVGNPSTKSRDTSSHTNDGIGKGCRRPAGDRASLLFRWQVSHAATYCLTSFFMASLGRMIGRGGYRSELHPSARLFWSCDILLGVWYTVLIVGVSGFGLCKVICLPDLAIGADSPVLLSSWNAVSINMDLSGLLVLLRSTAGTGGC